MSIHEDAMELFDHAPRASVEGLPLDRALALARAWCRALRLDEAAALLRPLVPDRPMDSDPDALRDALGLARGAPLCLALEALARTSPAPASERLSRAAQSAWDAVLP